MVSDAQVRKLMREYSKDQNLRRAAMVADMDRKTARRYRDSGMLPSASTQPRGWKTRANPFEEDWPEVVELLDGSPDIEVLTIFQYLGSKHPDRYQPNQLRTLQRHVRRWRAQTGPDKRVFFAQEHRPGEAFQLDWTDATELEITIGGERFDHRICHVMLPYSNWEWGTVCESESFVSLRGGLSAAVARLGRVPTFTQTDNTSAATHKVKRKRDFNEDYLKLMGYFDMTPRTTEVGAKEQNGDVESSHRHLKRRLKQRLILRGSRDFESPSVYQRWLEEAFEAYNAERRKRVTEELAHMDAFTKAPLPSYVDKHPRVGKGSTISVLGRVYSLPSRLIGHTVRVRVFERHIEVEHDGVVQLECERLRGNSYSRIVYRHIIWSLVRKPGAFARYCYREELFPSLVFRQTYDELSASGNLKNSDLEYLRILHLAASGSEQEVGKALQHRLDEGIPITFEEIREAVSPPPSIATTIPPMVVDLDSYNELLCEGVMV